MDSPFPGTLPEGLLRSILFCLPFETAIRLSLACKPLYRSLVVTSLKTLFHGEFVPFKGVEAVLEHPSAFTSVRSLALPRHKESKVYYETLIRFLIAFKPQVQHLSINFDDKLLSVHRNSIMDNITPAQQKSLTLSGSNDLAYKQLFQLNFCNLQHLTCPLTEKLIELSRTTTTLQTLTIDSNFRLFSASKRATEPAKKAVRALCSLVGSNPKLEVLTLLSPRIYSTFAEFLLHLIPKFDSIHHSGRGLLDQMEKLSLPARILRINDKSLFEHCLLSHQLDFDSNVFEDMWSRTMDPKVPPAEVLFLFVYMLKCICEDIRTRVFSPIEKLSLAKIEALEAIFIECQKHVPADDTNARVWGPYYLGTLRSYLDILVDSDDDDDDQITDPDSPDKHMWWKLMAEHSPQQIFTTDNITEIHESFFKYALGSANADFAPRTGLFPTLFATPRWWTEVLPNGACLLILEHPRFDANLILQSEGGHPAFLTVIRRAIEESKTPPASPDRLIRFLELAKKNGLTSENPLGFSAYTDEPHWCLRLHDDETLSRITMLFFEVFLRAVGHVRGFLVTHWFEMGGNFSMVNWLRGMVTERGGNNMLKQIKELDMALWYSVFQMTELEPLDAEDLVLSALAVAPPPPEIWKLFALPDQSFDIEFDGYSSNAVRLVQAVLLAQAHG